MEIITAVLLVIIAVLLIVVLTMTASARSAQKTAMDAQDMRLAELGRLMERMAAENEQKLENIRITMERNIKSLQEENNSRLREMQNVVDEKLQKTLEERISQSFRMVNERLEQVHKGLGEMQNLAAGVGDLKKVLSNVKTRGVLGEIQLGAILEEILSPDQYEENTVTKSTGAARVEFAVKLPGGEDHPVYLPIDAKFPLDRYEHLLDAYEEGDKAMVDVAVKELRDGIRKSAKDISEKYLEPPYTTDFAIMFLPVEGLYSEVVRMGLVEELQKTYKINVAGPTTMAALLNSLQMGFRTLAIKEHSNKIWGVLEGVRAEFENFEDAIQKTQNRIKQAGDELEKLVGTRTRAINRKLKGLESVEKLPERQVPAEDVFGLEE